MSRGGADLLRIVKKLTKQNIALQLQLGSKLTNNVVDIQYILTTDAKFQWLEEVKSICSNKHKMKTSSLNMKMATDPQLIQCCKVFMVWKEHLYLSKEALNPRFKELAMPRDTVRYGIHTQIFVTLVALLLCIGP